MLTWLIAGGTEWRWFALGTEADHDRLTGERRDMRPRAGLM